MREALRRRVETALVRLWFLPRPPLHLGVLGLILTPFSWLTALVARRRRAAATTQGARSPPRPLIVVGNLVVGGAGKTPLVIALARALSERGWHCGLLCRGYRGLAEDRAEIVMARGSALRHGDEALVLAQHSGCIVAAGASRRDALALLLAREPGIDVVISDDGLQHHRLPRSVELAVFDRRGVGNARLLPAGPLREPLSHACSMDALVINGGGPAPIAHPRVWKMHVEATRFVNVADSSRGIAARDFARFIGARPVRAIAGIASPERFFEMLGTLGIDAARVALPDHARLEPRMIEPRRDELVVMTEKDAVKCREFAGAHCWWLQIDARCDPEFIDWLENTIRGQATA